MKLPLTNLIVFYALLFAVLALGLKFGPTIGLVAGAAFDSLMRY